MSEARKIGRERVAELLDYSPVVGVFTWRKKCGIARVGQLAGTVTDKGYIKIQIGDHAYYAHILAWLLVTGEWPENEIDHRDGDTLNNAFDNLRAATHQQQMCNAKRNSRNTSGVKGVSWNSKKSKWLAQIRKDGKAYTVGFYDDISEAEQALKLKREQLHGAFANHGTHLHEIQ